MTDRYPYRYPYRHHGPAVHGSKLADFLVSEANMIDDGLIADTEGDTMTEPIQSPRYQPYGGAGMLPVEQCEYSVVDNEKGTEICRCWDVENARHIAFRMNLDNPAADTLAAQGDIIDALEEALEECAEALDLHGATYPHMVKGYTLDALTNARNVLAQAKALKDPKSS